MTYDSHGRPDICHSKTKTDSSAAPQLDEENVDIDVGVDSAMPSFTPVVQSPFDSVLKDAVVQRSLKQLFIRGDNVISIRLADTSSDKVSKSSLS